MTSAMTRRLARAVLLAGLALPMTTLLPAAAPFAITQAHAQEATTIAQFKSILANYGTWGTSDKYGDIWVPTVTPQGWHPYPPCQWVFTKDGWYFNDNTPWGAIVHHYGRWSHDEKIGWFWVPDEDWSPGWVVWRKSDQWIGWAPMPPKQDYQLVSSDEFNNDKLWIFMDVQKFRHGECGGNATNVSFAQAYYGTSWTSLFDLPEGLLVDVIYVPHWTVKVIKELVPIFIPVPGYCPPNTNPPNNNPPGTNVPGANPRPAMPQNTYNPVPPLQQNPYYPVPTIQQNPYNPPATNIRMPTTFQIDLPNRKHSSRGGDSNGDVRRMVGADQVTPSVKSPWHRPHLSVLNPVGHSLMTNSVGIHAQGLALSRGLGGGMGRGVLR